MAAGKPAALWKVTGSLPPGRSANDQERRGACFHLQRRVLPANQISRQLGAKYYITGKVGSVDEFFNNERRVQYTLFVQVIEVETSLVRFQNKAERSKAIVR